MLDAKKKDRIIKKFRTHEKDTGSPEVQIAILTEEIKELTTHLQHHKHDYSSRRGLFKKLGERKRLLRYLRIENQVSYEALVAALKIKISKKALEKEEEIKRLLAEEDAADEAALEDAPEVAKKEVKEDEEDK